MESSKFENDLLSFFKLCFNLDPPPNLLNDKLFTSFLNNPTELSLTLGKSGSSLKFASTNAESSLLFLKKSANPINTNKFFEEVQINYYFKNQGKLMSRIVEANLFSQVHSKSKEELKKNAKDFARQIEKLVSLEGRLKSSADIAVSL